MKKLIIVGVLVIIFVGYILYQKQSDSMQNKTPISGTNSATPTTTSSAQGSDGTTPQPTAASQTASGSFKDGTYTGSSADAFYGTVQVEATITGGKLTDVSFLKSPSGGHSTEVSNFAIPALKQEAIQAQSATVNVVSGATQTSQAFTQSLASALTQAQ